MGLATHRRISATILIGATIVAIGLLASRASYVPIWDGRFYTHCIFDAARAPFAGGALRCGGHASHAYVALAVLAQRIIPSSGGSYPVLLATNAALLFLACFGFYRLSRLAFPGPEHAVERSLLTAGVALHPSLLAAVVQPGLDLPLVPGFLWCAVFLLERRWVLLIATGIAMAFTKETGVMLYAALLATFAAYFVARGPAPLPERAIRLVKLAPLCLPGLAFLAYLLHRRTIPGAEVLWYTSTIRESIWRQLLIPRLDLHLISYLSLMLLLNFAWIATTSITLDGLLGVVRRRHRLPRRPLPGADARIVGFLSLVAVVTAFCLTRFVSYGFTRYVLVFMALLPIPFYASLVRLELGAKYRRLLLGSYAALLAVSAVWSIDPVSRWVWGTFQVGDRSMFRMTSITGEPWGAGQEHLAYSLQFTRILELEDEALAGSSAADPSTVLVVPDSTHWVPDWRIFGELDPRTHRRTLRRVGVARPTVLNRKAVVGGARPSAATFVALPNGASAAKTLSDLARYYWIGAETRFRRGRYWISVYPLSRRSSGE